jgi:hypothetical protein
MLTIAPGALKIAIVVLPPRNEIISITSRPGGRYELRYGFYGPHPGAIRNDVMKALATPIAGGSEDRAAANWFTKLADASASALTDDLMAATEWGSFRGRRLTDSVADMAAVCGVINVCEEYPEWQGAFDLDEAGQEVSCLRYAGDLRTRERMNRVWPDPCGLPWKMIRLYQE